MVVLIRYSRLNKACLEKSIVKFKRLCSKHKTLSLVEWVTDIKKNVKVTDIFYEHSYWVPVKNRFVKYYSSMHPDIYSTFDTVCRDRTNSVNDKLTTNDSIDIS